MVDRYLAGDNGRSALVTIVDNFEEIATLLAGERGQAQSSRMSKSTLDRILSNRAQRPSLRCGFLRRQRKVADRC